MNWFSLIIYNSFSYVSYHNYQSNQYNQFQNCSCLTIGSSESEMKASTDFIDTKEHYF